MPSLFLHLFVQWSSSKTDSNNKLLLPLLSDSDTGGLLCCVDWPDGALIKKFYRVVDNESFDEVESS